MADLREVRRVYEMVDENADGVVSVNEICRFIKKLGIQMSEEDLRFVIMRDRGEEICSEILQFEEFVDLYQFIFNREQDEEGNESEDLMEAFNVFDDNKDGYISCEELQRVLLMLGLIPQAQPPHYCKQMICRFDSDCNGLLDFSEFKNMMSSAILS